MTHFMIKMLILFQVHRIENSFIVRLSCSRVEKLCYVVVISSKPTPEQLLGWVFKSSVLWGICTSLKDTVKIIWPYAYILPILWMERAQFPPHVCCLLPGHGRSQVQPVLEHRTK